MGLIPIIGIAIGVLLLASQSVVRNAQGREMIVGNIIIIFFFTLAIIGLGVNELNR